MPDCGEMKLAHTVCKFCGYYDGKLVKEIKVKESKEEAAAKPRPTKAKKEAKRSEKAKSAKQEKEK